LGALDADESRPITSPDLEQHGTSGTCTFDTLGNVGGVGDGGSVDFDSGGDENGGDDDETTAGAASTPCAKVSLNPARLQPRAPTARARPS
jgi:hypothetical protein